MSNSPKRAAVERDDVFIQPASFNDSDDSLRREDDEDTLGIPAVYQYSDYLADSTIAAQGSGGGGGAVGGAGANNDGSASPGYAVRGGTKGSEADAAEYTTLYPSLLDETHTAPTEYRCSARRLLVVGSVLLCVGIVTTILILTIVPQLTESHSDDSIADLYGPPFDTPSWRNYLNDPDPQEFDMITVFNISNAQAVMFDNAAPELEELGPFVFDRSLYKIEVTLAGGVVDYIPWLHALPYDNSVSFREHDGSVTAYNTSPLKTTSVRMLQLPFASLYAQLLDNPLQHPGIARWQTDTCHAPPSGSTSSARSRTVGSRAASDRTVRSRSMAARARGSVSGNGTGLTGNAMLKCLDATLEAAARPNASSLNMTLTSGGDELLALGSVEAWLALGFTGSATMSSRFWTAIDATILRNSVESTEFPVDTQYGYLFNTTQKSMYQAKAVLKHCSLTYSRAQPSASMKQQSWNGYTALPSVAQTAPTGRWNVLDYGIPFPGWGAPISISGRGFSDGRMTFPGISPQTTPAILVWSSMLARPLRYEYSFDYILKGLQVHRYELSSTEFQLTSTTRNVYGHRYAGLANMAPLRRYTPLHASPAHFRGFESDPELRRSVPTAGFGPGPSYTRDATFIDVEPTSGVIVNSATRLQLNMVVPEWDFSGTSCSNYRFGDPTRRTSQNDTILPAIVINRRFQLTEDMADYLASLQPGVDKGEPIELYGGLLGGLTALIGLVCVVVGLRRRNEDAQQRRKTTYGYGSSSALIYDATQ